MYLNKLKLLEMFITLEFRKICLYKTPYKLSVSRPLYDVQHNVTLQM